MHVFAVVVCVLVWSCTFYPFLSDRHELTAWLCSSSRQLTTVNVLWATLVQCVLCVSCMFAHAAPEVPGKHSKHDAGEESEEEDAAAGRLCGWACCQGSLLRRLGSRPTEGCSAASAGCAAQHLCILSSADLISVCLACACTPASTTNCNKQLLLLPHHR